MKRGLFIAALALAFLTLRPPLQGAGQLTYLSAGSLDVVALLPPPPAAGSAEAAADLAITRTASQARTPKETAEAMAETRLTIFNFAPAIGPWFKPGHFPKTEAFFKQIDSDTGAFTRIGKTYFQRPRPYTVDPTIVPLVQEESFSYPSGHATRGTVFALVLAELFPSHREALLGLGRDAGWHRVVAGIHYPGDIFSGRVLGQAIVREMLKSPAFLRDLTAVKAELGAASIEIPSVQR
jgi:acid phosphatase (class A)